MHKRARERGSRATTSQSRDATPRVCTRCVSCQEWALWDGRDGRAHGGLPVLSAGPDNQPLSVTQGAQVCENRRSPDHRRTTCLHARFSASIAIDGYRPVVLGSGNWKFNELQFDSFHAPLERVLPPRFNGARIFFPPSCKRWICVISSRASRNAMKININETLLLVRNHFLFVKRNYAGMNTVFFVLLRWFFDKKNWNVSSRDR